MLALLEIPVAPARARAPALIVVAPVQVFAPVSVTVPAPFCVSVPFPEMVFDTVRLSERLNTKAALLVTFPVPRFPDVPPMPSCSVPPLRLTLPEKSFTPLLRQVARAAMRSG